MDYCNIALYAGNCVNDNYYYIIYNWASYGGWERWFQGTFSPYLFYKYNIINQTEGKPKGDVQNNQRVDFILEKGNEVSYVELKCIPFTASLGTGNIDIYCNGVYEDWKKLYYRSARYLISLVLIPADINGEGVKIKNRLVKSAEKCGINYCIRVCTFEQGIFMYVCTFNITSNNAKMKFLKD